jgi:O-antigen/teichoic acid export membrane protein
MSRSRRFLGGLTFAYLNQAAVMLVGLWLTPFFLRTIGQRDYGLWLAGTQLVSYLMLMDLGIIALLPREVAYATGRSISGSQTESLSRLTGESARVVLLQTPVVALCAAALWLVVRYTRPDWQPLQMPLLVVMAVFVLFFPLRIFLATLDGLQDLAYIGRVQFVSWAANVLVTIFLVSRGWGLAALAAGWVVLQSISAIAAFLRLRSRFPHALPNMIPKLDGGRIATYFKRGVWLSVAQTAQSLLSGTDFLIITFVLGPTIAVVYSCTSKLVTVLANQPQMLMNLASPAICELKATGNYQRLLTVCICLTRVMMSASGLVACVVLAANDSFVAHWVPTVQFGGIGLTALLIAAMLLRHLNATTVTSLICFGQEKRISLTTFSDGVVTLVASLIGIHFFGLAGGPIGSIIGALCVSLPLNFAGLAAETHVTPWVVIRSLFPWAWRFAIATGIGLAIRGTGLLQSLPGFFAGSALIGLIYIAFVAPLFFREPLAEYTRPLLARLRPVAA